MSYLPLPSSTDILVKSIMKYSLVVVCDPMESNVQTFNVFPKSDSNKDLFDFKSALRFHARSLQSQEILSVIWSDVKLFDNLLTY